MSGEDRDNILAGLYRRTGKLAEAIDRLAAALARNGLSAPVPATERAPTLPGLGEDWTPPELAPPPREWGNTVRTWEALHGVFGDSAVTLDAIATNPDAMRAFREATKGRIGMSTIPRVLSALVAAGAASRGPHGYELAAPTDELRAAVENARKGGRKTA